MFFLFFAKKFLAWLGTTDGAAWLGTTDGAAWLGTTDGAAWLGTNYGYNAIPVTGIALLQSGGGSGTWQRVNINGNDLAVTNFDNVWPWSEVEVKIFVNNGQPLHVVKIPKFYCAYKTIAKGKYSGKKARWFSPVKLPNFHIHPAFVKNGKVMDCFYIGAYEAYPIGNNKAGCTDGVAPWVNIGGFENARTYCNNSNTDENEVETRGWHLQNIYEDSAINSLILIELGTPDVQSAIARGNADSSAVASTGSTAAVWRGIHEWWGNVLEHVDGLTIDANGIYQIFSNKMDGSYVSTGVTNPASGWITEMSEAKGTNFDLTDVFLPSATNDTEGNGTYGDYHWTGKSTVLLRSGSWLYGSDGGAFSFYVRNGASSSGGDIGLRLAKEGTVTGELAA